VLSIFCRVFFSGRNGDTIRSITRQTKAKIVVDTPGRRSETRPVVISLTGTAEAIDTAKVLLHHLSLIGILDDHFSHLFFFVNFSFV